MNKQEIDIQSQRKGCEIFEGKINWTCIRGSCDEEFISFWDLVTPTIIELRDKQEAWLKQDLENRRYLEVTYYENRDSRISGFNKISQHFYVPHKNENITAIQRKQIQEEMELAEAYYWVGVQKLKDQNEEKRLRIQKLANQIYADEQPRRRQSPPRAKAHSHLSKIRANLRKDCG